MCTVPIALACLAKFCSSLDPLQITLRITLMNKMSMKKMRLMGYGSRCWWSNAVKSYSENEDDSEGTLMKISMKQMGLMGYSSTDVDGVPLCSHTGHWKSHTEGNSYCYNNHYQTQANIFGTFTPTKYYSPKRQLSNSQHGIKLKNLPKTQHPI